VKLGKGKSLDDKRAGKRTIKIDDADTWKRNGKRELEGGGGGREESKSREVAREMKVTRNRGSLGACNRTADITGVAGGGIAIAINEPKADQVRLGMGLVGRSREPKAR